MSLRRAALVAGAATALLRLPFAARRMWDHDSIQFALGVERYDLAAHHPHPPGYPLYIAILKLLDAARPFASPAGHRHLVMRFWLHVVAAVVRPGFESCLHHFRAAERIATLRGILDGLHDLQLRSQTNK